MAFRAPLLGYNTNVRHKGKLYHIQTEDSGTTYAHIITHLFADGGRIVASRKTSYSDQLGNEGLQETVKKLMQAQHKAMFIALRDGLYDDGDPSNSAREQAGLVPGGRDQAAVVAPVVIRRPTEPPPERPSLYQGTRGAHETPAPPPDSVTAVAKPPLSIFGSDLLTEKSLDEVILSYLATDDGDSQ